ESRSRERHMTDHQTRQGDVEGQEFQWHPQYRGRSAEDVERDLARKIAKDQRAYEVALSGAEESEYDALASVMDLEKRWSIYSFGWAEMDPDVLARRIVDFEL